MSAMLTVGEPNARYLVRDAVTASPLVQQFDLLITAPAGVARLRALVLTLAVRGKLMAQEAGDEPASMFLRRMRTDGDRLTATIRDEERPFRLPASWAWARFNQLIRPDKPIAYGVLVPGPEVPDGVPFVRIADLSVSNPAASPEKSIAPEVDARYQRTRLEGGEILMGLWEASASLALHHPLGRAPTSPARYAASFHASK